MAESFAQSGFARFMNSSAGRITRIVAGLGLIGWGYTRLDAGGGILLMVVGLIPLAAGLFDVCIISPFVGGPIAGGRVRELGGRK